MNAKLSRREFTTGLAGIVVYFSLAPELAKAQNAGAPRLPGTLGNNRRLDAWLKIGADGTVTVSPGRVELGQGNLTALAQIAADELDIAFSRVRVNQVDTAHSPNEGVTAGSNSIEAGGSALRAAAAEARAKLTALIEKFEDEATAYSSLVLPMWVKVPRPNSAAFRMKWLFGAEPIPMVKRRLAPSCVRIVSNNSSSLPTCPSVRKMIWRRCEAGALPFNAIFMICPQLLGHPLSVLTPISRSVRPCGFLGPVADTPAHYAGAVCCTDGASVR